jgi:hypothetical protein
MDISKKFRIIKKGDTPFYYIKYKNWCFKSYLGLMDSVLLFDIS